MFVGFFIFVSGLIIGSFINALQYRIQIERKNTGRSFCPKCKHQLVWYDLVPVFSWVLLGGKCRYCHKKISIQYPVIELITGFLFVAFGMVSGLNQKINEAIFGFQSTSGSLLLRYVILLLLLIVIVAVFVLLALHDAKTSYILSFYVYAGVFITLAYHLLGYTGKWQIVEIFHYLTPYILSGIIPALFFLSIYILSKGKWMGAGDAELALLIGFFLGYPLTPVAFYFAFIVGSIYGVIKIMMKKSQMKSALPFGPFLIGGCFFAFLFLSLIHI